MAFGVKRSSRFKTGRYRVRFANPQPDTSYIVGVNSDRHDLLHMVVACAKDYCDVAVYALDGTIAQPKRVGVEIRRI